MPDRRSSLVSAWCVFVVFVGAFLLFQIQPIISKRILPWYGGTPGVWTTCMLFFQVLLLGGYLYAHLLTRWASRWTVSFHAIVLAVAMFLPITPNESWKPPDSSSPTFRILCLLLTHVGLPYLLLATTGPLVQAWFARLFAKRSPYRLYSVSNAASLLALLSYPFLVEPVIGVADQCFLWAWCFVVYAIVCGGLALYLASTMTGNVSDRAVADLDRRQNGDNDGIGRRWWVWLLLPALASMLLLAVTNRLSQDVAVTPLLWVTPLGIYLLTFILSFDNDRWYHRFLFAILGFLSVVVVCFVLRAVYLELLFQQLGWSLRPFHFAARLSVEATSFLVMLFVVCMICHGETVRKRPAPRHLTAFYLTIAAGGALGGVLVSLVCPLVFSSYLELSLALTTGFLVCAYVAYEEGQSRSLWKNAVPRGTALILFVIGVMAIGLAQLDAIDTFSIAARRNFYGVLRVEHLDRGKETANMAMYHGRILHGFQWTDERKRSEPTSYYEVRSGVGMLLENLKRDHELRVGVLGLGVGTLAAYGKEGDYYCFYEINPDVRDLAVEYFSFLRDSQAETTVVIGDARLIMERQPPQNFDVLVLDAFSSDAVPVHLLTLEAFDIYLRHVRPDGVIAAHLSNRHLDLASVVRRIARERGLVHVTVEGQHMQHVANWLLLSRKAESLQADWLVPYHRSAEEEKIGPLWTDDRSNLLQIMK